MFLLLTTTKGCQILINFSLATKILENGLGTVISFKDDNFVNVKESLEEIYDKIKAERKKSV